MLSQTLCHLPNCCALLSLYYVVWNTFSIIIHSLSGTAPLFLSNCNTMSLQRFSIDSQLKLNDNFFFDFWTIITLMSCGLPQSISPFAFYSCFSVELLLFFCVTASQRPCNMFLLLPSEHSPFITFFWVIDNPLSKFCCVGSYIFLSFSQWKCSILLA